MEGATASGNNKVVLVMGATATGKSKLAIDLALRFDGEVINSDKIQVHDGLDVITNKVTAVERMGVAHHLIGGVSPDADYTAADFCRDAVRCVESVLASGHVPIIAGGSNTYIQALLDGEPGFRLSYHCCFLWVDAELPALGMYIHDRVDSMLEHGLVDEVRPFFRPDADYSMGIWRAIGVPEMDAYYRKEAKEDMEGDDELRAQVLAAAVEEIKANTCRLARRQQGKIQRLCSLPGWSIRRLDVTEVLYLKVRNARDQKAERDAWEKDVAGPAAMVVGAFLVEANVANNKGTVVSSRRGKLWLRQASSARRNSDGACAQLETAVVSPGRGLVGF